MPQHPPAHDETVRMRGDRPDGRPPLNGSRTARREEADDTRPVTHDWLLGAPEAVAAAPEVAEAGTEQLHLSDHDRVAGNGHAVPPVDTSDDDGDGSDGPPPGDEPPTGGAGRPWWRRGAVLAPAGAVLVLAAAYGVDLLTAQGSIPRSTVVAGIDIGGLSPSAAARTLQHDLTPKVMANHTVVAAGQKATLSPAAAGIALDVQGTVAAAAEQPLNPWTRLVTLVGDRRIEPVITADATALSAQLETIADGVDQAPVDATIAFQGTTPHVVPPTDGRRLDREASARRITSALATGGNPATPIDLPVTVSHVHVESAAAQRALDSTVTPALSAPVTIVSKDGAQKAEVPVSAIAASLAFTPKDDGTLAVSIAPAALQKALGQQLEVFGTPATDARFEASGDTVRVIPSKDGTGITPAHLAEQLMAVLTGHGPRTVTAELGAVPASFTTEQAKALGITEKVSSFTTHFASVASGTNIRVVAAKVDGALVKPGETFSLNGYTGPRGTAQGYVPAAVISGGQLSKAVGGGISQFATTMFNAVFFAGLQDVHHKTHSFYISRYPAGREATVYEGLIDLQWKNDSPTGIFVDTQWSPGTLTVTFYGTKHYDIESVSGARTNPRQPAVQDKVDDGSGSCIPQSGVPGFDITVTRVFHDLTSGAVLRTEDFHTHYAAEAIIHCIPPTAPTPTPTPSGTSPAPTPGG
ncbi:MAG: VanW family protein [Blastococcus sp.]